jgi:hypothetical protein
MFKSVLNIHLYTCAASCSQNRQLFGDSSLSVLMFTSSSYAHLLLAAILASLCSTVMVGVTPKCLLNFSSMSPTQVMFIRFSGEVQQEFLFLRYVTGADDNIDSKGSLSNEV